MSVLPPALFAQATASMLGRITSGTEGIALSDVLISIPGSGLQVLSGSEGWYFLAGIPEGRHEVAVELIGYGTVRDTIQIEAGDAIQLHLELHPDPVVMDELVVEVEPAPLRSLGHRRVVGREELAKRRAATTTELLQGLVVGVTLTPTSGDVGAAGQVRIRGVRSLRENGPLFFVDGIRIGSTRARGPEGTGGAVLAFLDNINPMDIERIEIIHASEATIQYGTDAAGGVILIFTRREG